MPASRPPLPDPRPARRRARFASLRPAALAALGLAAAPGAGGGPAAAQPADGGLHPVTPARAVLGAVFDDADGDGRRGAAEAALAGRRVQLDGPGGAVATALTDGDGRFGLPVAAAGRYTATVELPAGWSASSATAASLDFTAAPDAAPAALGAPLAFAQRRGAPAALAIDVAASSGCATGAAAATAVAGDEVVLRFAVRGAAAAVVSILDLAPSGAVRTLADRRAVAGGQSFGIALPAGEALGTRRIVWRAYRDAGGGAPAAEADCAFEVVAPDGPHLAVRPDGLAFDRLGRGGSADRVLTVVNRGRSPLTVFGLDLQNDPAASPFRLPAPWSANAVLLPGEERGLTVRFAPTADGAWQDFVLIRTDDPARPLWTVPVTGETTAVPRLAASVATDRGCLTGDSGPLYVAGEAVGLVLNVNADGAAPVQAIVEERLPDGETVVVSSGEAAANRPWRRDVRARRALGRGGARLSVSTSSGQRYAYGDCDWLVAAGLTDIAGVVDDIGGAEARPLAGARVSVVGPEVHSVVTAEDGAFRVAVAQPGVYQVTVAPPDGFALSGAASLGVWARGFAGEALTGLRFAAARSDGAPTPRPTPPAAVPTLAGPTPTPLPPTPAPTATLPTTCQVTITPRTGTVNVGQRVALRAAVSPTRGSYSYAWGFEGEAIADYSESTASGWRTVPLRAADLRSATLALYWKPAPGQRHPNNVGPVARRVWVTVRDGVGGCSDSVTLNVERNATSSTRQAEDFYTANHTQFVLREHALWHQRYAFDQPFYDGALFFDFHVQFLDRFNRWRHEFGYPEIGTWDAAQPIPRGPDIDHASRNAIVRPFAKPASFTAAGGARRGWNQMPCDVTGGGQLRLLDYPADRRLLGCAVTEPWHNTVHLLVGGDMLNPPTAPRDPVFWRWHRFVDTVNRDRQRLAAGGLVALDGARPPVIADGGNPAAGASTTDAGVLGRGLVPGGAPVEAVYVEPFHLHPYVVALERYAVTFDGPVEGVRPSALTVNGAPATAVTGAGAGPYVFAGFAPPPPGAVTVALDRSTIARARPAGGVAGMPAAAPRLSPAPLQWRYTRVDASADADGDGLANADEVLRALTWPDDADSDDDGLDDAAEWRLGTFGLAADSDGDGATDGCEAAAGSDPRSPASRATACGTALPFICRPSPAAGAGPDRSRAPLD